jgi:hypothetical protein
MGNHGTRSFFVCALLLAKSAAFQGSRSCRASHHQNINYLRVLDSSDKPIIAKTSYPCDRAPRRTTTIRCSVESGSSGVPYGLTVDVSESEVDALKRQMTLIRVILPAVVLAGVAILAYPALSIAIKSLLDTGELSVIGNDSSQFIQNFVTVNGLTLSILCGNTFIFLYQQTEQIYRSLYAEVSEAKSLLEQSALVCAGRPFYKDVLFSIQRYVANDLRRLDYSPATLLSARPESDPLESVTKAKPQLRACVLRGRRLT